MFYVCFILNLNSHLIDISKAQYLVTGDKDLLVHDPFISARILTPIEFEKQLDRL
jgi:uncharacterized protein